MKEFKLNRVLKPKIRGSLALGFVLGLFCLCFMVPKNASAFDNSNVISDAQFSNSGAMDEAAIYSFLASQGSYLTGYVETRSNYMGVPEREQAKGHSAAYIINWVAKEYGINPQVILTTLQKEQSLIRNPNLNQYGLDFAMGYGCFESMGCQDGNPYQGFSRQVDWGAWQLKFNMLGANNTPQTKFSTAVCGPPGVSPYCTGRTISVSADVQGVCLGNGATASLYRYTPHIQTSFNNWFNSFFGITPGSNACYVNMAPVYRFYNKTNGTHFYTVSAGERDNVIRRWSNIYKYEGVAYNLTNGANHVALWRFYNKTNGTHFYTSSVAERDNVIRRWSNIYRYEGWAYDVSGGGSPVYRFYKTNGSHFYTASAAERDNVIRRWSNIYRYEGIAFYFQ